MQWLPGAPANLSSMGTAVVAYALTTATGPVRGAITLAVTPWIARVIRKRGR